MDKELILRAVTELGELLSLEDDTLATAESCTGGLIASTLTDVSGSSEWFRGGVVAYANEVKENILGVPQSELQTHGAVSEEVVKHMAMGVQKAVGANVSVAVSGIAGPTGGTPEKPVGTVWIAWAINGSVARTKHNVFFGTREEIKNQTVMHAVNGLLAILR
ncbi:CinA family protein [Salidesulfovibrio brasiliensis]|uniref:CinA family protein n=1 Tax=Salidesulfovibrio brasiliensis TaxID=221711 RepID=UPI0006D1B8DE|nr:CinA family protein [Salidesulfovibrio brasiliensis]